jgi:hypothetical protein
MFPLALFSFKYLMCHDVRGICHYNDEGTWEKDIKDKTSARLAKASKMKVRVHFTALETLLFSNSILALKKND